MYETMWNALTPLRDWMFNNGRMVVYRMRCMALLHLISYTIKLAMKIPHDIAVFVLPLSPMHDIFRKMDEVLEAITLLGCYFTSKGVCHYTDQIILSLSWETPKLGCWALCPTSIFCLTSCGRGHCRLEKMLAIVSLTETLLLNIKLKGFYWQ